jgi:cleavage and polyadenylation specificity factor subunit 1
MEVTVADLLPDGKELYIVAADTDCNIHILQYDPERKSFINFNQLVANAL